MVHEKAKYEDFCRRWQIVDLGSDGSWSSEVNVSDRFVIVRNRKQYRFIPVAGFRGSMTEATLSEDENAVGAEHEGESLQGVLWAEFGPRKIQFSLSKKADESFDILLDDYRNCAVDDPRRTRHGGPHGSDN